MRHADVLNALEVMKTQAWQKVSPESIDAGKRAYDKIALHYTYGDWDAIKNKWVAVSLADGSCDGNLYDSKQDAIRHQIHEMQCAYISLRNIGPGGANAEELAIVIQFQRDAYKAGFRMPDPDAKDGGKDVLMTAGQYDYYRGKVRDLRLHGGN